MKIITPLLLLLLLFISLRMIVLFTEYPQVGFGESFRATAAHDFISDRKFDLFDYTFRHNEGGSLVVALIAALFFKIFGVSLFSLHLVPALFSFITLITGYYLVKKYCGQKEAILFGLVFIFAPQTYIKLSLTIGGNHAESILFTLGIIYCLGNIFFSQELDLKKIIFYYCLLGFICGFSIWFAYINLIGVLTCIVCIFIFDRIFFIHKSLLYFLLFFVIGSLPLIIYNITYAHGGVGSVLYKPLYAHFFNSDLKSFFAKAHSLFAYDFPLSMFFKGISIVSRETFAYLNYLCYFIVFFLCTILKIKSNGLNMLKYCYGKENFLNIFIFAYLLFFISAYLLSDFSVDSNNICNGYRYIAAIIPLFFILFSQAFVYLSNKGYISFNFIYILLIANLLGLFGLVDFKDFLQSAKVNPVSYQSFGWSIGNKFGYNFRKCLTYFSKINLNSRDYFFQGLGEEMAQYYINEPEKFNIEFQSIPELYRLSFYASLGHGIASKLFYDFKKVKIVMDKIDKKYTKYAYLGLGASVTTERFSEFKHISKQIDAEYSCHFYEGVGGGVFYASGYNIDECNSRLNNLEIDEQYKQYCYSGISYIFLDETIQDKKKYYILLESYANKIDEKYRGYFLKGLEEKRLLFN